MLKLFILSLWVAAHPVHVSLMSVAYNDKKDLFEVFVKLYYDDFVTDYWYSVNDDQMFEPDGKIDTAVILVKKYPNDKILIFADDIKLKGELTKILGD